ncbi:MAG: calcium-binding protein [Hyphomicrobium sp.]
MAIREGTRFNDRLLGTNFADIMEGKAGNDVLFGFAGNDIMDGDLGNDRLLGGAGNDNMEGGAGNDVLFGEAGNDIISGDDGNDVMNGGLGNDTFLFDSGEGDDRITGFTAGGVEDRLNLTDAAFNFVTMAQVNARAHDVGANVVIDLGAGDSVTLIGVHEAQLRAVDFIL